MSMNLRQNSMRKLALNLTSVLWCCSPLLAFGSSFDGADVPDFQPNAQARDLVRKVVANELKQEELDKSHYMFKLKKVTPKGTRLQEIVQTDQGSIARTLLINDQPPTEEMTRQEEEKIHKLIDDPDEQRK